MRGRLAALWAQLLGSLWFVPGAIVLGAIALAVAMVELSARVDAEALARWPRVFGASADSSRSMLSAIAGSIITVAGVTFSITIVAVTQASSQYTPRILRNFMRDRANQVVLGAFVGIFAYCLVVLRTIRGGDDEGRFVPALAVLLGVLLAVVGIGILIFFVHHIASTLQASGIVARVTRETIAVVERLFPEVMGEEAGDGDDAAIGSAKGGGRRVAVAPASGYVQRVDADGLLRVARERGVVVWMHRGIGDFVVEGAPLAWIVPGTHDAGAARERDDDGDGAARAVAALYVVSSYRTVDQDPDFGVRQLVDIALKALSPGVNDTTTAVTCVDYLGAILVRVAGRRVEAPLRAEGGVLRVVARGPTFESLLRTAVDEVRQNAGGNVSVLARLFGMLELVAAHARTPARRALVREQVDLVWELAARTVDAPHDRARLAARADEARGAATPGDRTSAPSSARQPGDR